MEQLALVDMESGNAIADSVEYADEYVEPDYPFDQMLEIARDYGQAIGKVGFSSAVNARVFGFVDGLSAVRGLSLHERELLRNACFAAAWGTPVSDAAVT